jgi:hypothetical protein
MREYIRQGIRASPILYRLLLRLPGRGLYDRCPRRGDLLHLTGFPRSANTYASYLVQAAAPGCEDRMSTHHHVQATIRMALAARVPTVVLVRHPLEAIASRLVMLRASPDDGARADEFIRYYHAYYRYVERVRERVTLANFRMVVEDPERFLELVRAAAPGFAIEAPLSQVVEQVGVLFEGTIEPRRAPEDRVMPDPVKEGLKTRFRKLVQTRPPYEKAEAVYHRLTRPTS